MLGTACVPAAESCPLTLAARSAVQAPPSSGGYDEDQQALRRPTRIQIPGELPSNNVSSVGSRFLVCQRMTIAIDSTGRSRNAGPRFTDGASGSRVSCTSGPNNLHYAISYEVTTGYRIVRGWYFESETES